MLVATWILLVLLLGTMVFAVVRVGAEPRDRTVTEPEGIAFNGVSAGGTPASGSVTGLYRNHSAAYWNWRFRVMRHLAYVRRERIQQLKRTLLHRPTVTEALDLASAVYGHGGTLWGLARCETGGTFNPRAKNPHSDASGLMQFMPGTFAHTPYGRFSIWSPYASAMAAGWMLEHGRRSEWAC